jgi:nitrate/nitrite transporter NarK
LFCLRFLLQVGNVGGLVGPWLIGRVVEATGGYAAALQALGLMVAAAGCLSWSFRRWRL